MHCASRYCPLVPVASYNQDTGLITAEFSSSLDFSKNAACVSAFRPTTVGWGPRLTGLSFELQLSVESLAIAMAVNLGIMSINDLELEQNFDIDLNLKMSNVTGSYHANSYFDIRYLSMSPILCLRNITAVPPTLFQSLCFLTISGTAVVLPIFNPAGNRTAGSYPNPCNCSSLASSDCNTFNLLAGYVIYDINILEKSGNLELSLELLARAVLQHSSYAAFNEAAFFISSATSSVALQKADDELYSQEFLSGAFQFCNLSDFDAVCSVVVFQSLDFDSHQVSAYNFPLMLGACSNSFTVSDATWY